MKLSLVMGLFLFSLNSFAAPVTIKTDLTTGRSDNFAKYDILQLPNGQVRVVMDPNRCSEQGVCTKMAVRSQDVTPNISLQGGAADRSIVINLERGLSIIVANKMNGDQDVVLDVNYVGEAPVGRETQLPLKPLVSISPAK